MIDIAKTLLLAPNEPPRLGNGVPDKYRPFTSAKACVMLVEMLSGVDRSAPSCWYISEVCGRELCASMSFLFADFEAGFLMVGSMPFRPGYVKRGEALMRIDPPKTDFSAMARRLLLDGFVAERDGRLITREEMAMSDLAVKVTPEMTKAASFKRMSPTDIYRAIRAWEREESDPGDLRGKLDALARERDYWRAEATTLRDLAQKTADQECVYLKQIAALNAQLRVGSPNVQPRPVPPHTTASDVKPAPEPKPFPFGVLRKDSGDRRRVGG